MTLALIMNQSGVVGHDTGSAVSGGVFVITSIPSIKVKIDGAGVYRGPLAGSFSGGNATGFVPGSVVGTWVINPTATKTKADVLPVVREGDTGTLTAVGTLPSPPGGTSPVSGAVVVSSAGQAVVNGD